MSTNPYQPPTQPVTGGDNSKLDPKLEKRIDTLYRNGKQFPLLIILGLFCPVLLLFAVPLGVVYARQRTRLLTEVEGMTLDKSRRPDGVSTSEKIDMLRRWEVRFIIAPMVVAVFAAAIAIVGTIKYFENRNMPKPRAQHSQKLRVGR